MEMVTVDTQQKIAVSPEIFDYPYNESLVHQAVVTFMSHMRSGNHAQKTRAEVRGGGKKPWKQKGTGRARAGTIRSPLWRGGGVVFAAKPRSYALKINKKMYRRAIRSIFSELNRRGDLLVVSEFKVDSHKTKDFLSMMGKISCDGALLISQDISEELYLGARNVFEFGLTDAYTLDPYSLLSYKKVVVSQDALKHIEEQLQ